MGYFLQPTTAREPRLVPVGNFSETAKNEVPQCFTVESGYRFYSPELGRWLSRDPIEEEGGINVYCFVRSCAITLIDRIGLRIVAKRPTEMPGKQGAFWADIFARQDDDRIQKKYPKLDVYDLEFAGFKNRIEGALKALALCCKKYFKELSDLGICGRLAADQDVSIYLMPQEREKERYDQAFPNLNFEIPWNGPNADLLNDVYHLEQGRYVAYPQTVTGLLTHEFQHDYDMSLAESERPEPRFEGADAEYLKALWENPAEKSAVDAENRMQICCPELNDRITRDKYTNTPFSARGRR